MLETPTMTSAVPPLRFLLGLCWGLAGVPGCGPNAPATREPAVAQVLVPLHSPPESVEPSTPRFHCDEAVIGETTRIEFRVQSAASDGSASAQTRAVYTITPRMEHERRVARAEVMLESLTTDAPDRAQSAWTVGLDAGWIRLRQPFEITRDGSTWCFVRACDDAARREFAGAIGDTAELVALPELREQLARADDTATLLLPAVLMKRIGLGAIHPDVLAPKARRRGFDFPAHFVVEHASSPESEDSAGTANAGPLTRAELLVSRRCRLEALRVELAGAGITRGGGETHRFSWSFDPLP